MAMPSMSSHNLGGWPPKMGNGRNMGNILRSHSQPVAKLKVDRVKLDLSAIDLRLTVSLLLLKLNFTYISFNSRSDYKRHSQYHHSKTKEHDGDPHL